MYLDKPDKEILKIVNKCFPSYNGKKFQLSTNIPTEIHSYWDGGSKTSYVFYQLATSAIYPVHSNHPMFESNQPNRLKELPKGIIIVAHTIFCGKDMGITIYANQDDLTPMLPAPSEELSKEEKIVLIFTRSLKNTYAGRNNVRFYEANRKYGISLDTWDISKEKLISKGFLNKAGAITSNGRNAVEHEIEIRLY